MLPESRIASGHEHWPELHFEGATRVYRLGKTRRLKRSLASWAELQRGVRLGEDSGSSSNVGLRMGYMQAQGRLCNPA